MTQYYAANANRRDAAWRRNQNTVAYRVQRGLGPVASTVMVILLLSVLGLIYLTQLTKTSTYGYKINELETKRRELESQRADLEVESARLQALERVKSSSVADAMTTPSQADARN
ncbi:hypothetical protein JNJ66_04855 [Candidatus Saccharibacteria bacterium]|nr:hypothetical protein [Candidatus Saccharibacteria bacterium]